MLFVARSQTFFQHPSASETNTSSVVRSVGALPKETAESRFRSAFERLRVNKPIVVPVGTAVSQNHVALEAGKDTSALRRTRFPLLVKDIQDYVTARDEAVVSARDERRSAKIAREEDSDRAARMERERDFALSKLNSIQDRLLDVLARVDELQIRLDEFLPPPSPLRR